MRQLKQEAARQGRTMSELVEAALRALLLKRPTTTKSCPLPKYKMGTAKVNVTNRDALYDVME